MGEQRLKSFLMELADLIEKYEAEVELNDFVVDFGVPSDAGWQWSGYFIEVTPAELRDTADNI